MVDVWTPRVCELLRSGEDLGEQDRRQIARALERSVDVESEVERIRGVLAAVLDRPMPGAAGADVARWILACDDARALLSEGASK